MVDPASPLQQPNRYPQEKNNKIAQPRRLPGPADCRLSKGTSNSLDSYGLFRDWQRKQNQSSVAAFGLETANGCPVLRTQEPGPEAYMRAGGSAFTFLRAPPKRALGEVRFLLTKTYMEVGNPEVDL